MLLFGAFTTFSNSIGRFIEILAFLRESRAINIYEALVIGIAKRSISGSKPKQNLASKRNFGFVSRFFFKSSMVQTYGADC